MAITTRNNANYGPLTAITVTASPFTFTNPEAVPINVMISGGTVTTIALSVDGSTFTTMGLLGGQFHLNPGQSIQVTYVVAPTMNYTAI